MNTRGQNIIEYVLLVVAVVVVLIVFLRPGGKMQAGINHTILDKTINQLQKVSDEIQ